MNTDFNQPQSQSAVEAIHLFIDEASQVEGEDYGDCMRVWNSELLVLRDTLKNQQASPWALEKLEKIQEYVQFTPNWHVPSTKNRLLKDAHELEEHFLLKENSGPDF